MSWKGNKHWVDSLSRSSAYTIPKKNKTGNNNNNNNNKATSSKVANDNNTKNTTETKDAPVLEEVSPGSREYQEIIAHFKDAYLRRNESTTSYNYSKITLINNAQINKKFEEKRRQLRKEGYSEAQLNITYAFLPIFSKHHADEISHNGISVGGTCDANLGDPAKGIHLCKYSDVLSPVQLSDGATGTLVVVQVIKGKSKAVPVDAVALDPTPMYDSHVTIADPTKKSDRDQYLQSRLYVYEYDDCELNSRPRTLRPVAIVRYKYSHKVSSYDVRSERAKNEHCVWYGSIRFDRRAQQPQFYPDIRLLSLYGRMKIFDLPRSLVLKYVMPMDLVMQWSAVQELAQNGMLSKRREVVLKKGRNHKQIASYWRFALSGDISVQAKSPFAGLVENMAASHVVGISIQRSYSKMVVFPPSELSVMLGIPNLPDHTYGLHCLLVSYRSPTSGLAFTNKDPYDFLPASVPKLSNQLRPEDHKLWAKFDVQHPPVQMEPAPSEASSILSQSEPSTIPSGNDEAGDDVDFVVPIPRPGVANPDIDERRKAPNVGEVNVESQAVNDAKAKGSWMPLSKAESIRDPRIKKRVNALLQSMDSSGSSISTMSGLGIVEQSMEKPGGAVYSDVSDISYVSSQPPIPTTKPPLPAEALTSMRDSPRRPQSPDNIEEDPMELVIPLRTIPLDEQPQVPQVESPLIPAPQPIKEIGGWKRLADIACQSSAKKPRQEDKDTRTSIQKQLEEKLLLMKSGVNQPSTSNAPQPPPLEVVVESDDDEVMVDAVIRLDGRVESQSNGYVAIQEPLVTSTTPQVCNTAPKYTHARMTHTDNTHAIMNLHGACAPNTHRQYRVPPDSAMIDRNDTLPRPSVMGSKAKVTRWVLDTDFSVLPPHSPSLHSEFNSDDDNGELFEGVENHAPNVHGKDKTKGIVFSAADLLRARKAKKQSYRKRLASRTGPLANIQSPNIDDFDDNGRPILRHQPVDADFNQNPEDELQPQINDDTLEMLENLNQNTLKVSDWLNKAKDNLGGYDDTPATPHTPVEIFDDDLQDEVDMGGDAENEHFPISPRSDDEIYGGAARVHTPIQRTPMYEPPQLDSRALFRQAMANISKPSAELEKMGVLQRSPSPIEAEEMIEDEDMLVIEEERSPHQNIDNNVVQPETNGNDAELWDEIMTFPEINEGSDNQSETAMREKLIEAQENMIQRRESPDQYTYVEQSASEIDFADFMPERFRPLKLAQADKGKKINEVVSTVLHSANDEIFGTLEEIIPPIPDDAYENRNESSSDSDNLEKYMAELKARRFKRSLIREFQMNSNDILEASLQNEVKIDDSKLLDALKLYHTVNDVDDANSLNKVDGLHLEQSARFNAECQFSLQGSLHRRVNRKANMEMASFETSLSHVCTGQTGLQDTISNVALMSPVGDNEKIDDILHTSTSLFTKVTDEGIPESMIQVEGQESADEYLSDGLVMVLNADSYQSDSEHSMASTASILLRSVARLVNDSIEQVCTVLRFDIAEYFFLTSSFTRRQHDDRPLCVSPESSFVLHLSSEMSDDEDLVQLEFDVTDENNVSYETPLEYLVDEEQLQDPASSPYIEDLNVIESEKDSDMLESPCSQGDISSSEDAHNTEGPSHMNTIGDVETTSHLLYEVVENVAREKLMQENIHEAVSITLEALLDQVEAQVEEQRVESLEFGYQEFLESIVIKTHSKALLNFETSIDSIMQQKVAVLEPELHLVNESFPYCEMFIESHKDVTEAMQSLIPTNDTAKVIDEAKNLQLSQIAIGHQCEDTNAEIDRILMSNYLGYSQIETEGMQIEEGEESDDQLSKVICHMNMKFDSMLDQFPGIEFPFENADKSVVEEMLDVEQDDFASRIDDVITRQDVPEKVVCDLKVIDDVVAEQNIQFVFSLDRKISKAACGECFTPPVSPSEFSKCGMGTLNLNLSEASDSSECDLFKEMDLPHRSSSAESMDDQSENGWQTSKFDAYVNYTEQVEEEPWPYIMWQHLKSKRSHFCPISHVTRQLFDQANLSTRFPEIDQVLASSNAIFEERIGQIYEDTILKIEHEANLHEHIGIQENSVPLPRSYVESMQDDASDSSFNLHIYETSPPSSPKPETSSEISDVDLGVPQFVPNMNQMNSSGKVRALVLQSAPKVTKKKRSLYVSTDRITRGVKRDFLRDLGASFNIMNNKTPVEESVRRNWLSETEEDYPDTLGSFSEDSMDEFGLRKDYSMILSSECEETDADVDAENKANDILKASLSDCDDEDDYTVFKYKHVISLRPSCNIHRLRHEPVYKNYNGIAGKGPAAAGSDFRDGILVPDDMVFIRAVASDVHRVLEAFLLWKQNGTGNWTLKLHSQVVLALAQSKKNLDPNSVSHSRLTEILQLLVRFRKSGTVDLMGNHECDSASRPAQEYLSCLMNLRQNALPRSCNVVFLTNLSLTSEAAQKYLNQNITVLSLNKFIEVVVNKVELHQPSPMLAPPIRL